MRGRSGRDYRLRVPDGGRSPDYVQAEAVTRRQLRASARRIVLLITTVLVLLLLGTVGLMATEGVGFWYALRWALDTAATVGGFPQPHTAGGQIVQVALVILGVGTLFYVLATVAELFLAGHVGDALALRRRQRVIDALSDHHIICGFGRVGRQVARDLQAARAPFLVVDNNADNQVLAEGLGIQFIEGDASEDAVLIEAGIERARAMIVASDSDASNVFITLTARELRGDISIVARAASEDTEKKLKRAGADRVISPYKSSGIEMARLALHPQLNGGVDVQTRFRIEEITVGHSCQVVGKPLAEIRGESIIVGLRRGGDLRQQPDGETAVLAGDVIVAAGAPQALERLESLLDERRC